MKKFKVYSKELGDYVPEEGFFLSWDGELYKEDMMTGRLTRTSSDYITEYEKLKTKIFFKDYHYECGDGCCSEWGVDCEIDGKDLGRFPGEVEAIPAILNEFGVDGFVNYYDEWDNPVFQDIREDEI